MREITSHASHFLNQPLLKSMCLVLEDRHSRFHAPETKFAIERFFAGGGIEDDFAVALGEFHQPGDNRFANALTLIIRVNGHVTNVGAVNPIGQCPPRANQCARIKDKTGKPAVGKSNSQVAWLLFP